MGIENTYDNDLFEKNQYLTHLFSFKDFATQFMRDNQWYGSYWAHLER